MYSVDKQERLMSTTKQQYDYVVVGLGKTGVSCVRYLHEQNFSVAAIDTRDIPPYLNEIKQTHPDVDVFTGQLDQEVLLRADHILISPGVSLQEDAIKAAREKGVPVYGDIELFCQQAKAPIIAITGSNGKSTVTTLIGEIARQAGINVEVGGNLGTPALDLLQQAVPEYYILELSSFQLDATCSLNAVASVVLNVSPDHMDRYDSVDSYAASKQKIYRGDGINIINVDDPTVAAMRDQKRSILTYSVEINASVDFGVTDIDGESWLCQHGKPIIKQCELGLKGKHNLSNALAALALAKCLDLPTEAAISVLSRFTGLPHRSQKVASLDGVDWINDSKATNVGSCIASIEGMSRPGQIILIAGGDSKEADLSALAEVAGQHLKHAVLIGVDANKIANVIDKLVPYQHAKDLPQAVSLAAAQASPGDIVLLAPACASLDMFDNYQVRGEQFVAAVQALEKT